MQTDEVGELTDRTSSDEWPSDDGDSGHNGDRRRIPGSGRDAQGPRRNSFTCSCSRMDYDDFGDRSQREESYGRRRMVGGVGFASSPLSAEAPEFRPAHLYHESADEPVLSGSPKVESTVSDGSDPMRLEASLESPVRADVEGSGSPPQASLTRFRWGSARTSVLPAWLMT